MRKLSFFIIMLCLLFYAGTASAEAVGAWNSGGGDLDIALPGKEGKRVCVSNLIGVDGDASVDIDFYGSWGDKVPITADLAAGQTVFTSLITQADTGIGTTAAVVIQRADNTFAEYGKLASFTTTAPTVAAATTGAFKKGDVIWEMDMLLNSIENHPATAADFGNDRGLFCGPPNSPVMAITTGAGLIEGMFGYYVDNNFNHPNGAPVGSFYGIADETGGLALPGIPGKRIVVTGINFTLVGAGDDINILTWTGLKTDQSYFSADEVATQTELSARADPGFADTSAWFFYERADGTYAEIQLVTSYDADGDAITSAALDHDYKENDTIRLAEVLRISSNSVDTIQAVDNQYGLFTVPVGYPVGIYSTESDGIIMGLFGYYEDAKASRRTLAQYTSDDAATSTVAGALSLALPGFPGKKTCVTSITLDPTSATTDDLYFYHETQTKSASAGGTASLTADLAAAGTALTWQTHQGSDSIAQAGYVVIQSPDGDRADLVKMTATTETAGTATAAHVTQAFPDGSYVTEMENPGTGWAYTNIIGAGARTVSHPEGIFCGPVGSPIGVRIEGANSQLEHISGFAE